MKHDVTKETDALAHRTAQDLQEALRKAAAPFTLEWDPEEGGTHVKDAGGRGMAFMRETELSNGDPSVDGLVAPGLTREEEARLMKVMDRIAPILVELLSRTQDGRGFFDSHSMKPVQA